MRTEQEIRDSICPTKEVYHYINYYCPDMPSLTKAAQKFARKNGCKLADVKIDVSEGYCDDDGQSSYEIMLFLEKVPKSTEEIEDEIRGVLIREKRDEEREKEHYEFLKKKFEG
jgi:hypothetical protein